MTLADLLEITEAAKILSVHPSTLRRWADTGKVPFVRTLSGRRKFTRSVLEQARQEMGNSHTLPAPRNLEAKTLSIAHMPTKQLSDKQGEWMSRLNEEQMLLFRYSGQRLLGLLMQFISRDEGSETFLDEGRNVAALYGRMCCKAGLSVSQTAEAFLFFRRSILESVISTAGLGGPNDVDGHRVFLRTSDFFDALLVATTESYALLASSTSSEGEISAG
jgi:excisionase family DNA binding protein